MLEKLKESGIETLVDALISISSREECYSFLEDLCTVTEVKAMAQRLEVAKMLEDHIVYSDIVHKTGASTATISRVNKCLNYGCDGYRKILAKLSEKENGNE